MTDTLGGGHTRLAKSYNNEPLLCLSVCLIKLVNHLEVFGPLLQHNNDMLKSLSVSKTKVLRRPVLGDAEVG